GAVAVAANARRYGRNDCPRRTRTNNGGARCGHARRPRPLDMGRIHVGVLSMGEPPSADRAVVTRFSTLPVRMACLRDAFERPVVRRRWIHWSSCHATDTSAGVHARKRHRAATYGAVV